MDEQTINKIAFAKARQIVRERMEGRDQLNEAALVKKVAKKLIPHIESSLSRKNSFTHGKPLKNQGKGEYSESVNTLFSEAFPTYDVSTALGGKAENPIATTANKKMPAKKKTTNTSIEIFNKFQEEVDTDSPAFASLYKKSEKSGIDLEVLGEVYNRGWNTWTESAAVSQQQYAFARVNSFINKGNTYFFEDCDLLSENFGDDYHVLYINNKPSVKYSTPHDAKKDIEHLTKKYPEAKLHLKKVSTSVSENFIDGKGPGKPGDATRHGLKGKSAAELRKIRSSDTASARTKQLAHWMLNMHHNESVEPVNEISKELATSYFHAKQDKARKLANRGIPTNKKYVMLAKDKIEGRAKVNVTEGSDADFEAYMARHREVMSKHAGTYLHTTKDHKGEHGSGYVTGHDPKKKGHVILTVNTGTGVRSKNDNPTKDISVHEKHLTPSWKKSYYGVAEEAEQEDDLKKVSTIEKIAAKHKVDVETMKKRLKKGIAVEKEHTDDVKVAATIALKHLSERPDYYEKLKQYVEETDRTDVVAVPRPNTGARKTIKNVERKPDAKEPTDTKSAFNRQAQITNKVIEAKEEPNAEKITTDPDKPSSRFQGTNAAVETFKKQTPGMCKESLNESFNIAFAAGVGVTLTAADLGMRTQGGFELHPSVIAEMEERAMAEDVKSGLKQPVYMPAVRKPDGSFTPAKTVMKKTGEKIIKGDSNSHDGD